MTKKEKYAKYLQSEHWLQLRKRLIENVDHQCENCTLPRWLSRYVYGEDLHVHHKNYACLGNEGPNDVAVLCKLCHEMETFGRSDFPEVKKVRCACCGLNHFNVYAEMCDVCRTVLSVDYPFSSQFNCKDPLSGDPVWKVLLDELGSHFNYELVTKREPRVSSADEDIPF